MRRCLSAVYFGLLSILSHKVLGELTFCEPLGRRPETDDDLHSFITRPDLRAPKFNVSVHEARHATPGFIFISPYSGIDRPPPRHTYETLQIGPHIYDTSGELVWSGAGLFQNRPAFDFKLTTIGGNQHLTFVSVMAKDNCGFSQGAGIVLDNQYNLASNVTLDGDNIVFDLHEFSILEDGKSAVMFGLSTIQGDADDLNPADYTGPRFDSTLREIDFQTRETLFEWKSSQMISESTFPYPQEQDPNVEEPIEGSWDYFHPNSIDKTRGGDYLVSSRHTDALYLISKSDGSIIWRLGGDRNSFVQDGFNFSRQHYARIQSETSEGMVVSIFDNAYSKSQTGVSAEQSAFMLIDLKTSSTPMTATLLQRLPSPAGEYIGFAGNADILENGNRWINWVKGAVLTEHTESGEVVWQAEWLSKRWNAYRAYKFNFTGNPTELPVAKSFATAKSNGGLATTVYVSWNGATEVKTWRVHAPDGKVLAETARTGFETAVVCNDYHPSVYVEALDENGESLSESETQDAELPVSWDRSNGNSAVNPSNWPILDMLLAFIVGAVCWEIFARSLLWKLHSRFKIPLARSGYVKVHQEEG